MKITLDLASSMNLITKKSYPLASKIIDRFHVQKLAFDAVQEIRIRHRWEAIGNENKAIQAAKKEQTKYYPQILGDGDTPKQLIARSRYLLFKSSSKWIESQKKRANVLFKQYPDIKLYPLCI